MNKEQYITFKKQHLVNLVGFMPASGLTRLQECTQMERGVRSPTASWASYSQTPTYQAKQFFALEIEMKVHQ